MEELHAEGLATHGDPESCATSREGRGEALAGARAGRAIEPRNVGDRGADAVGRAEGNTPGGVIASRQGAPRGQRSMACAGTFVRENREVPCLPVRVVCGRAAGGTLRR